MPSIALRSEWQTPLACRRTSDLAGPRRREVELRHLQRRAHPLEDGGADLQRSPPGGRAPGVPSTSGGRSLTGGVSGAVVVGWPIAGRGAVGLDTGVARLFATAGGRFLRRTGGPLLGRSLLQLAQLLDRVVAAPEVARLDLLELRLLLVADVADVARAAGVEHAARRRVGVAGDLALEPDALALLAVRLRDRRQQRLGVGVVRRAEHRLGVAELHQPPEVEHGDAVGEVAHDAEVVRDEQVGDALVGLQLGQQVEDRRLHGDVERRGRLVADHDARLAGERARDRDALLEPARELRRARVDEAHVEADRVRELVQVLLALAAGVAAQLLERARSGCAARRSGG